MMMTISEITAVFTVTDVNGNAITLSATLPENALREYWNKLVFSKCYNNNTNVRIKNIKVYGV